MLIRFLAGGSQDIHVPQPRTKSSRQVSLLVCWNRPLWFDDGGRIANPGLYQAYCDNRFGEQVVLTLDRARGPVRSGAAISAGTMV
jgi:hypothetical protein